MFLAKDPSGYWYIYYDGVDGKRKRKSTRSKLKSDALKFLQEFKIDLSPNLKTLKLSEYIKEFLAYAKLNFAKGTFEIYDGTLRNFLRIVNDLPLSAFTPRHWDTYKTTRVKQVAAATVNIELRTVKATFNTALRWKLIQSNPFSRQPMCPIPASVPIFFTKEDFQIVINKIEETWLKEIVIFAVLTGLRRGEISNLKWQNINLKSREIIIESDATFKTKHGRRRIVPLNDTALYILQQKANKQSIPYVFSLNGNQVEGDWMSHKFKDILKECGLRESTLHFHSLRHTFASWLVQDGVSIYAVKELLGHTSVKTTEVYSHLSGSGLHREVNAIKIELNTGEQKPSNATEPSLQVD
jgi:integrase